MKHFTTPIEVLDAVQAVIDTPEKWTKGWFARDAAGKQVWAVDENAVCFCVMGAFTRGAGGWDGTPVIEQAHDLLADAALLCTEYYQLTEFNDTPKRTHAEVMKVFDVARELHTEFA